MEIGDLLHAARDVARPGPPTGVTAGLFLVVVVAQDKAEQEAGHHDVPNPQHREVAACGAAEQGPGFAGAQGQTSGHPGHPLLSQAHGSESAALIWEEGSEGVHRELTGSLSEAAPPVAKASLPWKNKFARQGKARDVSTDVGSQVELPG